MNTLSKVLLLLTLTLSVLLAWTLAELADESTPGQVVEKPEVTQSGESPGADLTGDAGLRTSDLTNVSDEDEDLPIPLTEYRPEGLFPFYGEESIGNGLQLRDVLDTPLSFEQSHQALVRIQILASRLGIEALRGVDGARESAVTSKEAGELSDAGVLVLQCNDPLDDNQRKYLPCPPELRSRLLELQSAAMHLTSAPTFVSSTSSALLTSVENLPDSDLFTTRPRPDGYGVELLDANGKVIGWTLHTIPGVVLDLPLPR